MLAVADPPQFESEQKKLNAAGNPCASLSIRILNSEVNTKHRLCYRSDLIISVLLHIWTVSLAQSAGAVDTRSIDEILTTTYDATPGTAGEKRDWDRFRNLCAEVATLSFVGRGQDGKTGRTVMTPFSYIKRSGASLEANRFFEIEIHRQSERFGNIAHVFSTYESRRLTSDPQPFARGINSFQLMCDGSRWYVVSIYWQTQSPQSPIPEAYLP